MESRIGILSPLVSFGVCGGVGGGGSLDGSHVVSVGHGEKSGWQPRPGVFHPLSACCLSDSVPDSEVGRGAS